MAQLSQSITGESIFQPDHCSDIAGANTIDFFALVGVHPDDAADALFFASGGVKDVAASFQYARVDADED